LGTGLGILVLTNGSSEPIQHSILNVYLARSKYRFALPEAGRNLEIKAGQRRGRFLLPLPTPTRPFPVRSPFSAGRSWRSVYSSYGLREQRPIEHRAAHATSADRASSGPSSEGLLRTWRALSFSNGRSLRRGRPARRYWPYLRSLLFICGCHFFHSLLSPTTEGSPAHPCRRHFETGRLTVTRGTCKSRSTA
jgi:hypothetical protein